MIANTSGTGTRYSVAILTTRSTICLGARAGMRSGTEADDCAAGCGGAAATGAVMQSGVVVVEGTPSRVMVVQRRMRDRCMGLDVGARRRTGGHFPARTPYRQWRENPFD